MLKRHPALQDLSRDHHRFLLQVQQIRWYIDDHERAKPLQTVIKNALAFWQTHGAAHLREEETVLLPLCRQHITDADTLDLLDNMTIDHRWLRDAFDELATLPHVENTTPLLKSLADYIETHVRGEERDLFMRVQEHLSDEQLAQLATDSAAFRRDHRPPGSIGRAGSATDDDSSASPSQA